MSNTKLHPELKKYLQTLNGMKVLRHPLVFDVPYFGGMDERLNNQLKYKQEALEEAIESKAIHSYIFLHERPYRLIAFCKALNLGWGFEKDPNQYWDVLADVWVDTESPHINYDVWKALFESKVPNKENFMDEEDKAYFDALPNEFTIYRGYATSDRKGKKGLSWTTSKETAEFFANRFSPYGEPKGKIARKKVKKEDVFGFTNRRNEYEIIYIK